jgi:cytochrome c peroxidase
MRRSSTLGGLALLALVPLSCSKNRPPERPVGKPVSIAVPLGLPPLSIPNDNPPTADTIALGRRLFYDPRLSVDNTVSCATCHSPALAFADRRRVSLGVGGSAGARNAPAIWNAAYASAQFWDGRADSLEDQAGTPISNRVEMNQPHDACESRLNDDAEYRELFRKAFGAGPITMERIKKALASFERTILSGNSPFDRYYYGGDRSAMSASAIRGLAVFTDAQRGNCAVCHTIDQTHALFTDDKFHNLGTGLRPDGELADLGRYEHTKQESDKGAFKTPTLRNVAQTAPYMHDGSLRTLREVVDFYIGGGSSNLHLDKEMKPLKLTAQERTDLISFLEALTGETPANLGPPPQQ